MDSPYDASVLKELTKLVVPSGRRLGLVIGIDSYADPIPKLTAAVADARAMHAMMVDPNCGCFAKEHTVLLTEGEANARAVNRELERLAKSATADDEVWIFFAGHAVLLEGGGHRLLPSDSEREYLDSSTIPFADSASKIKCSRKVVFLDCCHSGATGASTRAVHRVEQVLATYEAKGAITFCSSDGAEQSVELPELQRGAFSYWLEKGLRGEADLSGDGVVTSSELWKFVQEHVAKDAMRLTNRHQTPQLKSDLSGDFYLSVNIEAARRKAQQAQESADLQRKAEEATAADKKTLKALFNEPGSDLSGGDYDAAGAILDAGESKARKQLGEALGVFRDTHKAGLAVDAIHGIVARTSPTAAAARAPVDGAEKRRRVRPPAEAPPMPASHVADVPAPLPAVESQRTEAAKPGLALWKKILLGVAAVFLFLLVLGSLQDPAAPAGETPLAATTTAPAGETAPAATTTASAGETASAPTPPGIFFLEEGQVFDYESYDNQCLVSKPGGCRLTGLRDLYKPGKTPELLTVPKGGSIGFQKNDGTRRDNPIRAIQFDANGNEVQVLSEFGHIAAANESQMLFLGDRDSQFSIYITLNKFKGTAVEWQHSGALSDAAFERLVAASNPK